MSLGKRQKSAMKLHVFCRCPLPNGEHICMLAVPFGSICIKIELVVKMQNWLVLRNSQKSLTVVEHFCKMAAKWDKNPKISGLFQSHKFTFAYRLWQQKV